MGQSFEGTKFRGQTRRRDALMKNRRDQSLYTALLAAVMFAGAVVGAKGQILPPYQTPVYAKPADDSVAFGSLLEASGFTKAANTSWVGAAAGNFCGGPDKQLILGQNQAPNFSVLRGPAPYLPSSGGTGSLGSSTAYPWRALTAGNLDASTQDSLVAVRQVTADGVPDLVVAKIAGNCDTPTIVASASVGDKINSDWVGAAIGNFDGTGKKIALLKTAHSNLFLVSLKNSQLSIVHTEDLPTGATQPTAWKALAAGDIDGDGQDELIAARQVSDNVSPTVYAYKWNATSGGFALMATSSFGNDGNSNWASAAAGDFNGDGRQAVVLVKDKHSHFAVMDFPTGATQLRILNADDLDSADGQTWTALATTDWLAGDQGASELIAVRAVHSPNRTNIFVYGDPFHRVSRDTGLAGTKAVYTQQLSTDPNLRLTNPSIEDLKTWLTASHANTLFWDVHETGDYTMLVQFLIATKGFAIDGRQLRVWLLTIPPADINVSDNNVNDTVCSEPESTEPALTTWNALDFFKSDSTLAAKCADVLAWASVAGRLAQDFPQLVGMAYDDFSEQLDKPFTPDMIAAIESNMRNRAPWMNFSPYIYYPNGSNWAANWSDLVLTLDSMVFYFRNQKISVCIGPPCDPTLSNAPGEIAYMSTFLPKGRKMLLGVYYVPLWSESATLAGQPPTVPYDYDLTVRALGEPTVEGVVAYGGLQALETTCSIANTLTDRFCALQSAFGTQHTPVPNLLNGTESGARDEIVSAGYVVGNVSHSFNAAHQAGLVFSQNPSPGAIAVPGSPVDFSVATAGVMVPNLLSYSQSAATASLTKLGLVPKVGLQRRCVNPGDVLNQSPQGGAVVAPNSTVNLTVDSGTFKNCVIK
jgi:hypothetical protein